MLDNDMGFDGKENASKWKPWLLHETMHVAPQNVQRFH